LIPKPGIDTAVARRSVPETNENVCATFLIVVPLPPGENPFAVKINNNNSIQSNSFIYVLANS
jgi:hypothetical protein